MTGILDLLTGMMISSWIDVRSNPLRSLVSVAGMIGAIVAVVVVNSLGTVSHAATSQFIAERYGRPATIGISASVDRDNAQEFSQFTYAVESTLSWSLRDMLEANGIEHVSVTGTTQVFILAGDDFLQVNGIVVSPDYQDIKMIDVIAGEFPNVTANGAVPHVVIRADLARSLGWTPTEAIGQPLVISTTALHSYKEPELFHSGTITVVVDGVATWTDASTPTSVLLVTLSSNPTIWGSNSVSVQARVAPEDISRVEQLVERWTIVQPQSFTESQVIRLDKIGEFEPVLNQVQTTGKFVSAIALAIGGLGILGVGLAGVRERSQEFGLRRALGSSKSRVFLSVLCQTAIESVLVILIAIPAAFILLQFLVSKIMPAELPDQGLVFLPMSSTVIGIIATFAVSLMASLIPSVRAARLSVVQALRS